MRAVGRGMDERRRVFPVGRDQLPRPPCGVGDRLAVAPGCALPVVHRAREDEADPDPAGSLDHRLGVLVALVLEVEEVDAGRDAVQEHLCKREGGAERDRGAVEPLRERIEHAVAPAHEVEVVTEATQERLEGMAVGVDRTEQERLAREHHVARPVAVHVLDRGDAATLDHHHATRLPARVREDEVRDEPHGSGGRGAGTLRGWPETRRDSAAFGMSLLLSPDGCTTFPRLRTRVTWFTP